MPIKILGSVPVLALYHNKTYWPNNVILMFKKRCIKMGKKKKTLSVQFPELLNSLLRYQSIVSKVVNVHQKRG